jgi:hypothetical protein
VKHKSALTAPGQLPTDFSGMRMFRAVAWHVRRADLVRPDRHFGHTWLFGRLARTREYQAMAKARRLQWI